MRPDYRTPKSPNPFKTLLIAVLVSLTAPGSGCAAKKFVPDINIGPKIEREITYVNASASDQRTIQKAYLTEDLKGVETEVAEIVDGNKKVIRADKDFVREDETQSFADETTVTKKAQWTWMLIRPDIAVAKGLIAPRITQNKIVKVLDENSKGVLLDVGGWYIVKKGTQLGV